MSYLNCGLYPLREGITVGFSNSDSQAVLLSWGLWEAPEADNDEQFYLPPSAA